MGRGGGGEGKGREGSGELGIELCSRDKGLRNMYMYVRT